VHRLFPAKAYEERFHQELVEAIRSGDVVWDVGANVGLYTEQFCQWVGDQGFVVAFEPGAECCERIRERLKDCAWVAVEQAALGESDMTGRFVTGESSVDSHLQTEADIENGDLESAAVTVWRGDTVCRRRGQVPNVVKVDVEGFEEEVLMGMDEMLGFPELRSGLVEVHFLKLEMRGRAAAPVRIERLIREKGFRTRWVDASHLVGSRP
jgi:FkbM family methyltransferase